jgi:AcrR family transcriptional regulator
MKSKETQNIDNQIKIDQIIAAAQVRFGHYGLQKTTMKEIATDLNISKALLYYYFPDKEHLYKSVVEQEHRIFVENINRRLAEIDLAGDKLKNFVSIRLEYFQTLLNLSKFRMETFSGVKKLMGEVWQEFYKKETEIIHLILQEGKEKQEFFIDDTHEIALLFLDTIKGLSQLVMKNKQIFYLEPKEYEDLKKRACLLTDLFVRGLQYK